jgi:hypothetical protein
MPQEERKRGTCPRKREKGVNEQTKVARDTRRKQPWALLSIPRPDWDRNKDYKLEAGYEA